MDFGSSLAAWVIFLQKALPSPNSSRTVWMMSSAWLSVLAKMSVLGSSARPGKMLGQASRKARTTVLIWSRFTTDRSSWVAAWASSSPCASHRLLRVCRSRRSTRARALRVPPAWDTSVSVRNTWLPTLTPSAAAFSWVHSLTTSLRKKPWVRLSGVAVRPTKKASQYSMTCRHRL